ncbi:SH3 domain-containing protein [Oscillibacter valericigenes]|nr:SH3 domain-containing protein [Oscillibacter valericigenes]
MSKKAEDAAAVTAVAPETESVDKSTESAAVQTAEAHAAEAELALADAEKRAETAESSLREALEAAVLKSYVGGYHEIPAVVVSPTDLNLREGPNKEYIVLEVLPDGTPLVVCPLPYDTEVPGWALVVSESGTTGWVMTDYLAEPPAEE